MVLCVLGCILVSLLALHICAREQDMGCHCILDVEGAKTTIIDPKVVTSSIVALVQCVCVCVCVCACVRACVCV